MAAHDVAIRPIRPGEHEALGELTLAAYRTVPGYGPSTEYAETLGDVGARAEAAEVLVAVDADGTLLGGVTYVPGQGPLAEFEGENEAGIRMLAVSPSVQRGGVGRRLVQACIDRANEAGRTAIVLHTTPAMTAAHALYESLGFRRAPALDAELSYTRLLAYTLALSPR